MKITFDKAKREQTLARRGLDFADAVEVFEGLHTVLADDRFEYGERPPVICAADGGDRLDAAPQPSLRRKPHAVWSGPMTTSPERPAGSVDPKLLEILVCPLTKGPLEYDAEKQELISRSAKLAYPIRDGIPIMLPEEARKID